MCHLSCDLAGEEEGVVNENEAERWPRNSREFDSVELWGGQGSWNLVTEG